MKPIIYAALLLLSACSTTNETLLLSFQDADQQYRLSADALHAQTKEKITDISFVLSYDTKAPYRFLIDTVEKIEAQIQQAVSFLDSFSHTLAVGCGDKFDCYPSIRTAQIMEVQAMLAQTYHAILIIYKNTLEKQGQSPLGLTEEEIKMKLEAMAANIMLMDTSSAFVKKSLSNISLAEAVMRISQWQCNLRISESIMINEMLSYGGGRVHGFDWDFLAITPKKTTVRVGEPFEATIGITGGQLNSPEIDQKRLKIVVNGDTLAPDHLFKHAKPEVGVHHLDIEFIIMNPYTRKVEPARHSYEYEVFDCD